MIQPPWRNLTSPDPWGSRKINLWVEWAAFSLTHHGHPKKTVTTKRRIAVCAFYLPSPSLTWNLKMMVSTRNLLFQGVIFRFHVQLWEGIFNKRRNRRKHGQQILLLPQYYYFLTVTQIFHQAKGTVTHDWIDWFEVELNWNGIEVEIEIEVELNDLTRGCLKSCINFQQKSSFFVETFEIDILVAPHKEVPPHGPYPP